jgi:hypothetical protein
MVALDASLPVIILGDSRSIRGPFPMALVAAFGDVLHLDVFAAFEAGLATSCLELATWEAHGVLTDSAPTECLVMLCTFSCIFE